MSGYSKIGVRLAILLLGLMGAADSTQGRPQGPANTQAEIAGLLSGFINSFNNLDFEKFRAYFADDATVIHPAIFPRRIEGRTEIERAWQVVFENIRRESGRRTPPYMRLLPLETKIQIYCDMAIVTFQLDRGGTSLGRRTIVLHKTGRAWKIVHLHASNIDTAHAN